MSEVWFLIMIVVNTQLEWVSPHTYPTYNYCEKVGVTTVEMAKSKYPHQPLAFRCTKEPTGGRA